MGLGLALPTQLWTKWAKSEGRQNGFDLPSKRVNKNGAPKKTWRNGVMPANRTQPAPIAQLDRALPSEGRGQRFESSWVRHIFEAFCVPLTNLRAVKLR